MRSIFALAAAVLLAAPLNAQGWIEPLPGHHIDVQRVRTAVSVRVSGRIALVEVEEWFENRGGALGEGDYVYPLPGEAVFSNFSLYQDDQELRGETMEAGRARAIYEEIVRRRKDPALIELVGHGLIRARVFPIDAGDRRKITLRYTQVLERAGDALQFHYAAGRRSPTVRLHPERHMQGQPARGAPTTFRMVIDSADVFADPFSPTHDLTVTRQNGRLIVRPEREFEGDFTLMLPFASDVVGIAVATHRPAGEDGYFMLTLAPGSDGTRGLPRDVTAVVDVSGSMSGEKIAQARDALKQLLGSLAPQDRFRLIAFSSRVSTFGSAWTDATTEEVRRARTWVDALEADGGTDIAGALARAFAVPSGDNRLPVVIFLTDGLPSVGERNPERIAVQAERSRGETRVFAFGLGYDVNTYLLDRLSDAGRGATQYVRPGESVEGAIGTLTNKIQHPVLTDLTLDGAPVELTEIYPRRFPDLFAGEELIVFGRYRGAARDRQGDLVIAGRRNRRAERFSTRVRFPSEVSANEYIPRLWAARKIATLSQELRLHGANAELEREVRETALRYGLLSEYTSYLVQEPMEFLARSEAGRNVPLLISPSAAPAQAHGVREVEAARVRHDQLRVAKTAEADRVADALLGNALDDESRYVAGRMFRRVAGMWTDVTHADSSRIVDVKPFSDAYFAILRSLPELRPVLREFQQVVVAGKKVSIRVSDAGVSSLSDRRVRRLVQAFRGS